VKSGVPEGLEFPAMHAASLMMSPMSYQRIQITHDNNMTAYGCN